MNVKINVKCVDRNNILAEETVSRRDNPAGGHQGASAEVRLSHVNGRHPGVSTWQS